MSKLIVLFNTVRYLKPKQVFYRIFYSLVRRGNKSKNIDFSCDVSVGNIVFSDSIDSYKTYLSANDNTFKFLNKKKTFSNSIDWNYREYGMLWAYNLNYFEFLLQDDITEEQGLFLLRDYISKKDEIVIGYDPYPISLRNVFIIRFLLKFNIKDSEIDAFVYANYKILLKNIEYHLLGNHLLENGYSLFIGSYYFKSDDLYNKAYNILKSELDEQILSDGAHFELSVMYHQILLYRLLDCINIAKANPWKNDNLLPLMMSKAGAMCSWLAKMTFSSGRIPMFSDAANGIAPTSEKVLAYAKRLGVKLQNLSLGDSTYRVFESNRYKMVMDVGGIAPTYQPGHANADTFTFALEVDNLPIIVDTGCSTYEPDTIRAFERGTISHNTVVINDANSSEVWASHRVGKRAKVVLLQDSDNIISANHNGYLENAGIIHNREFSKQGDKLTIIDQLTIKSAEEYTAQAYIHLDHNLSGSFTVVNNTIDLGSITLQFEGATAIDIESYEQAIEFNKRFSAQCVRITFVNKLITDIIIK